MKRGAEAILNLSMSIRSYPTLATFFMIKGVSTIKFGFKRDMKKKLLAIGKKVCLKSAVFDKGELMKEYNI